LSHGVDGGSIPAKKWCAVATVDLACGRIWSIVLVERSKRSTTGGRKSPTAFGVDPRFLLRAVPSREHLGRSGGDKPPGDIILLSSMGGWSPWVSPHFFCAATTSHASIHPSFPSLSHAATQRAIDSQDRDVTGILPSSFLPPNRFINDSNAAIRAKKTERLAPSFEPTVLKRLRS